MSADHRQPVLFLFGTLEIGGSETKFVALAKRLMRQGHDVHVAYLRPPDTLLERLEDVPCIHLDQQGKYSPGALKRLKSYVEHNGIATIVTVNFYPLCYAVPLKAMSGRKAPKIVASINTTDFVSDRESRFMLLYRALLRKCDRIVFGAKRQQETWRDRYRLQDVRSDVVYNGVDTDRFNTDAVMPESADIRHQLGIPADAVVIVSVGQFRPEKAQGDLVRAASGLPDSMKVHVLLVGDGAERENLEACIEQSAMTERCHLVGAVDDVRPFLKVANIFALPSIAVETFSNAALEAASMGLPVVMSDIGGAAEMFPGQMAAKCVPPGDVSALESALLDLLRQAGDETGPGSSLRSVVLDRYSIAAMDRSWQNVLWEAAPLGDAAQPAT